MMRMRKTLIIIALFFCFASAGAMLTEKNDLLIKADVNVINNTVTTKVFITNLVNTTRNLSVYSYTYSNGACTSGRWTGNAQDLILQSDEEKELVLNNTVQSTGEHDFKVRVREGGERTDLKAKIVIGQNLKNLGEVTGNVAKNTTTTKFVVTSLLGLATLYVAVRKV